MKFDIVGLDENYGKHRFSNNTILQALAAKSIRSDSLSFVWWVEKIFLQKGYEGIVEHLCSSPWFGVMHVPLLTPNWAMTGQNHIAKLYYMKQWRSALKNCKGIITLSNHMKEQVESLYPELKVYSVPHPVGDSFRRFDMDLFKKNPRLLHVGTWLRDFDSFANFKTEFSKTLILNQYARSYFKNNYSRYVADIENKIENINCIEFVDDDEYDNIICTSVVYLKLLETSANNLLCECILYNVPFVANRHPAIIEYCGENYPLFVENFDRFELSYEKTVEAENYLKETEKYRDNLKLDKFLERVEKIYYDIVR